MAKCTVGILGCGSMGEAMAVGWHKHATALANVLVYVKHEHQQQKMSALGIQSTLTPEELYTSDVLILAVRPEQMEATLLQYAPILEKNTEQLIISVAAGIPLATLRACLPKHTHLARLMPNISVSIGQGVLGLCFENTTTSAELIQPVTHLCETLGVVIPVQEAQMNSFTALAGCGPGLHFHIMDSFIEAGVRVGLSREQSASISKALMRSCGAVAEITQTHPVVLREQGTSPLGMTIEGLSHLDRTGVRGHIIDAVQKAYQRGKDMDTGAKD